MNGPSYPRRLLRSPDFFLWRLLAFVIGMFTETRFYRLARSGIGFNRWRSRLGALGPGTTIYPNVVIHEPEKVFIGEGVSIVEFVHIWGGGKVTIGDFTMIAASVVITSQTHEVDPGLRRADLRAPVVIGKNVWIGSGAIILPGVIVGDNAVVAAGAVVVRNVEPGTVVRGVPATCLRKIG